MAKRVVKVTRKAENTVVRTSDVTPLAADAEWKSILPGDAEYVSYADVTYVRFVHAKAHATEKANLSISSKGTRHVSLGDGTVAQTNVCLYWPDATVDNDKRATMIKAARAAEKARRDRTTAK